jgi:hypothetical protein
MCARKHVSLYYASCLASWSIPGLSCHTLVFFAQGHGNLVGGGGIAASNGGGHIQLGGAMSTGTISI